MRSRRRPLKLHTERGSICACVVNQPTRPQLAVATAEPHICDYYSQMCPRGREPQQYGSWSKGAVWRADWGRQTSWTRKPYLHPHHYIGRLLPTFKDIFAISCDPTRYPRCSSKLTTQAALLCTMGYPAASARAGTDDVFGRHIFYCTDSVVRVRAR